MLRRIMRGKMVDIGNHAVALRNPLAIKLLQSVYERCKVFDLRAVDLGVHKRLWSRIKGHRHLCDNTQVALKEETIDLRAEAIRTSMCAWGTWHSPLSSPEDFSRSQNDLHAPNEVLAISRDSVAMATVQGLGTT